MAADDDDDEEDFLDEPDTPVFEQVSMMDLEVVDSDLIRANYEELIAETESLYSELFEMESGHGLNQNEAIRDVLSGDLQFFEDLNNDFHLYEQSLLPNQPPTSADFIKFLRDERQWNANDIAYVQVLADELDAHDGIGFINDI